MSLKGIIIIGGVIVVAIAVFSHHDSSTSDASSSGAGSDSSGSNIYLVASKSFCVPTGIDDIYTGDGHVTFFLMFRNSGSEDGSVSAVPVRHYDDGQTNDSPMDGVNPDMPAGSTQGFHTTAMVYEAHAHEVVGCGVVVEGRAETIIEVR